MLIRILTLALTLLISTQAFAFQECFVDTDCSFQYVPASVADGFSRDATLTLSSTDDLDVCWNYSDDSTCTAITEGNQTDSCPPASGEACLTQFGNGSYKVEIDASIVNESGKMLCIDVTDEQGTRTVGDAELCKFIYPEVRTTLSTIWAYATRLLTAGTNIVLAKGTGLTGLNDIAATAVVSGGAIDTTAGAIDVVTLVTTTTTNTDMVGTDNAALATALSTHDGKLDTVDTNVDTLITQIGTAGAGLTDLGAMSTAMKAEVETEVDDALTAFGFATAADVADDVWDELKADHTDADSFGDYLDTEVSGVGGGTGLTAQQTRDAMKLAPTGGAPAAGSVDEHLDDILDDTADIQPNYATSSAQTTAQTDLDTITGASGALLDPTATSAQLVDDVWDEPLTGATHNDPTSAGRRLRSLGDVTSASVDDASATTISFITDLPGGHDGHYDDQTLLFTSGTLTGMSRIILDYVDSTKRVTIEEDLPVAPGNGDDFDVNPVHVHPVSQIVDEVWDEILSKSTHNIAQSAGKIVREQGAAIFASGTAQAGGVNTITLEAGESALDDLYIEQFLLIEDGTGQGQGHHILGYNGTTKVAILDDNWTVQPDSSSDYVIMGNSSHIWADAGKAAAGTSSTITFNGGAIATDDYYNDMSVYLHSGAGSGQARRITDYVGSTKVATVGTNWTTDPDNTTGYSVDSFISTNNEDVAAILDDTGMSGVAISQAGADTVLDTAVEGAFSLREIACIMAAVNAGKLSTSGSTATFRGLEDTEDRAIYTFAAGGNRSAVTFDLTGCQ